MQPLESNRHHRRPLSGSAGNALVAAALLSLLLTSCAPRLAAFQPALRQDGSLELYLQPLPQEAQRLLIHLAEIAAIREDGSLAPLQPLLSELQGSALMGVQRRLASATLSPGTYRGISLHFDKASLLRDDGAADLLVPDEPLSIQAEFRIIRRAASTLFLTLAPENLTSSGFSFTPSFSLATPTRQLQGLLGYATNTQSNTISVFNKRTMEIVDTIATASGPQGAAIDPRRGWMYVALAGDDAIEAIEVNTGVILHRLQLNFGDEPTEIALSPDGRILVSANRGTNTASVIDTSTLREIDRVGLPSEPFSVVTGTSGRRAYLIQPLGNAISEIDVSRREVNRTLILDESPVRGALSRDGDNLYVTTRFSSDLLVIDTAGLSLKERIHVGSRAACVEVDPKTDLVYVGRESGSISVVEPSSLMPIDRIRVDGHVAFLDIDRDQNSLLALLPDRRLVRKIDLVSRRVAGAVEIAEGGYAVVLMNSR